jgi:hypothetical protein
VCMYVCVCDEKERSSTFNWSSKGTEKVRIVATCVDDSGRWGTGGVFSALSAISSVPQQVLVLASCVQVVHDSIISVHDNRRCTSELAR